MVYETIAILVALGLTTIGLISGSFMNFVYTQSVIMNTILIFTISGFCTVLFGITLKKQK